MFSSGIKTSRVSCKQILVRCILKNEVYKGSSLNQTGSVVFQNLKEVVGGGTTTTHILNCSSFGRAGSEVLNLFFLIRMKTLHKFLYIQNVVRG